jgi:hypothetical protein
MKKLVSLIPLAIVYILAGCTPLPDAYTEKTYISEDQQITGLCIDVRDTAIEVIPSSDGKLHIDYFDREKETYAIEIRENHILTMTTVNQKEWTDYFGRLPSVDLRKITVQVPNTLLDDLSISTSNEEISVSFLKFNDRVFLDANGADISFEQLEAGEEIILNVKNGKITGTISGSYDEYAISCSIKKGECNLPSNKENGRKKLVVTANHADVNITIE